MIMKNFYKVFFLGESRSKKYYYSQPLSAVVSVSKKNEKKIRKLKSLKIGSKRIHKAKKSLRIDNNEFTIL